MKTIDLQRQLEALVDATSLTVVLFALDVIAGEKADHVAANWQDASTAKAWDRASRYLAVAARQIDGLGI